MTIALLLKRIKFVAIVCLSALGLVFLFLIAVFLLFPSPIATAPPTPHPLAVLAPTLTPMPLSIPTWAIIESTPTSTPVPTAPHPNIVYWTGLRGCIDGIQDTLTRAEDGLSPEELDGIIDGFADGQLCLLGLEVPSRFAVSYQSLNSTLYMCESAFKSARAGESYQMQMAACQIGVSLAIEQLSRDRTRMY